MSGEPPRLTWLGICRLGLVQCALGSIVVLVTSTLNRVMVVEYRLPAMLPGVLVGVHYAVQLLRPRFGHGSDRGGRRTPWILGGIALLGVGGILCAVATTAITARPLPALALAIVAYVIVGVGVAAAGTPLLLLMAQRVDEQRRAAAATIMWILMIAGFAVASVTAGRFLDPFSPGRLTLVLAVAAGTALVIAALALWGVERRSHVKAHERAVHAGKPHAERASQGYTPDARTARRDCRAQMDFRSAFKSVWAEPEARQFTWFVFVSMLAYSAQELLLEPFAGGVFGYTVGESASLSGLLHGTVLLGMLIVGIACSGTRRAGSLRAWSIGGCVGASAALLSMAAADWAAPAWPLRASVGALGVSNGVFAVSAIASMMALAHRDGRSSPGVRMGLWGAAQAVAFALGGLASTAILDLAKYLSGSPAAAFGVVFCVESALFLIAAHFAAQVGRMKSEPMTSAQRGGADGFDVAVIGGGPAGATAAVDLARAGFKVCLLDRAGRVKPCGGAIPPKLMEEFDIPQSLLVARVNSARMVSPANVAVDMPIEGGYVGMVDRDVFDEWLRQRAQHCGAELRTGAFLRIVRDPEPGAIVHYRSKTGAEATLRARAVIGADGAMSNVAKQCVPGADRMRYVAAYHEIVRMPAASGAALHPTRCDVYYQGELSPDFYAWIFPHGATASIGVGSARKGFSLRTAVAGLRTSSGSLGFETVRREGAPIPMKPLKRWDNGRDVVLAGDASGVVAPASGEGIYYAMAGGRMAARAAQRFLATGDPAMLRGARKEFMKAHGMVFWVLGIMQRFWYSTDKRRERFVSICKDPDVQRLTWQAYMHKKLVRAKPLTHLRIFAKDMAHLLGLVRA